MTPSQLLSDFEEILDQVEPYQAAELIGRLETAQARLWGLVPPQDRGRGQSAPHPQEEPR